MNETNGLWWRSAACRGLDTKLFFPVGTEGPARRQEAKAKAVCRRCPVAQQCRDWALAVGELGVWGGTSEAERLALTAVSSAAAASLAQPKPVSVDVPPPDEVVVERLMAPGQHSGATREEIALAAVGLVERGWTPTGAAVHLGVRTESVRRWVRRAAAGEALVQNGERLRKGRAA